MLDRPPIIRSLGANCSVTIRPGPYLHYHITWWCGMPRVYPDVYFKKYDVLGDDVIITDDWPGQYLAGPFFRTSSCRKLVQFFSKLSWLSSLFFCVIFVYGSFYLALLHSCGPTLSASSYCFPMPIPSLPQYLQNSFCFFLSKTKSPPIQCSTAWRMTH